MLSCWARKSAQLSPRHTCSMFVRSALWKKGLVWEWGGSSNGVGCLTGKAEQQNISLKMCPVSHWSIVDPVQARQPYIPFKHPLEAQHHIPYACHTSGRKAQTISFHLPSKVICQSLGTGAGIKWTRVLLRQWLQKRGHVSNSDCGELYFVWSSRLPANGILWSVDQPALHSVR